MDEDTKRYFHCMIRAYNADTLVGFICCINYNLERNDLTPAQRAEFEDQLLMCEQMFRDKVGGSYGSNS